MGKEIVIVADPDSTILMALNGEFVKLVKQKNVHILVNNQLSNSLNAFNFNNPAAIAKVLLNQNKKVDFANAMKKAGISKNVLAIEYAPEAAPGNKLKYNSKTSKSLTLMDAVDRIAPKKLQSTDILEKLKDRDDQEQSLQLALTSFTMESMHKMNLRVGNLLNQTKEWAQQKGLDDNFYFYVSSPSKSPIIIKQILTDAYGIPESRFLSRINRDTYFDLPWTSPKAPMVLVLDDFIGSGDSMHDFIELAKKQVHFQSLLKPSFHAFAPYSTPLGIDALERRGKVFVESTVLSATKNPTYKKLRDRHRFQTSFGYGSYATGISFEYMSPDNNASTFRPYCECWSYPGTIKTAY